MKHITIKIVFSITFLLLVSIALTPASITHSFAQSDEDAEIFAVSSLGEKLDFKATAVEIAKSHNAQSFNDKLMHPAIPVDMEVDETLLAQDDSIGDDDRIKITDTTYFPWSTVAKIHGNFDSFQFDCSGWMLGPSTVVTAAHCIYDYGDTNTYATNVIVTPAMNSDSPDSEPFGNCEAYQAWIINLWETTGNAKYDYGVYALRCRIGEQTGNLGYRVIGDAQIDGALVNVTGYPLDKGGTTMWFGLGNVLETPIDFLYYDNYTSGGQSGAPVWELINDSCQTCVVAIHSGSGGVDHNVGVRVTNDVFDFLFAMQQWVYYYPVFLPVIFNNGGSSQMSMPPANPYPAPDQADILTTSVPYPLPSGSKNQTPDPYPAP